MWWVRLAYPSDRKMAPEGDVYTQLYFHVKQRVRRDTLAHVERM